MPSVPTRRIACTLRHLSPADHGATRAAGPAAAAAAAAATAATPPGAAAPYVDRAHFEKHGYCVVRNMLTDEDLSKVERDYDVLVNQRAQQWLQQGHLTTTHGDMPFDKRLAAIAADLPQEIQVSLSLSLSLSLCLSAPLCLSASLTHTRTGVRAPAVSPRHGHDERALQGANIRLCPFKSTY